MASKKLWRIFKEICIVESTMFFMYMKLQCKSIWMFPSRFVTDSGRSRLLNTCYIRVKFIQQSERSSFRNASVLQCCLLFFPVPCGFCFCMKIMLMNLIWPFSPSPPEWKWEKGTVRTATLMLPTSLSCLPLSSLCSMQPKFSPGDGVKPKKQLASYQDFSAVCSSCNIQ